MNSGMMALTECAYSGVSVRMFGTKFEPWFALVDVCQILGLSNSRRVAQRLDDDEKGVTQSYTPGGVQEITIINEPGLYRAHDCVRERRDAGARCRQLQGRFELSATGRVQK